MHYSFASVDIGFDPRVQGMAVDLPEDATSVTIQDGDRTITVDGDREALIRALRDKLYKVTKARSLADLAHDVVLAARFFPKVVSRETIKLHLTENGWPASEIDTLIGTAIAELEAYRFEPNAPAIRHLQVVGAANGDKGEPDEKDCPHRS